MLRYVNTQVTFSEVPDEIALCINLSNCPIHCKGCHSQYLWNDVGTELTEQNLEDMIKQNMGITCICFMGGDSDPELVNEFSKYIHSHYVLRTAWYSGRDFIPSTTELDFDYVKVGPYKQECGPINDPNTNQRFYARGSVMHKMDANPNMFYDMTNKFWNKI